MSVIYLFIKAWLAPYPSGIYRQIDYYLDDWILTTSQGNKYYYQAHRIALDMDIFFLLMFDGEESGRCTLLIFKDQLSEDAYRQLRIMAKVLR